LSCGDSVCTVLVTATWQSLFIATQLQERILGEKIVDACTILCMSDRAHGFSG